MIQEKPIRGNYYFHKDSGRRDKVLVIKKDFWYHSPLYVILKSDDGVKNKVKLDNFWKKYKS